MAAGVANSHPSSDASANEITYYQTKDFQRALKAAFLQGGKSQRKQSRV